MNYKYFLIILGLIFVSSVAGNVCLASNVNIDSSLNTAAKESGLSDYENNKADPEQRLAEVVVKYVVVAMQYLSLVFLILVVYAGLKWMTAGGQQKNLEEARKTMIHAAIGLAATLLSYSIVHWILTNFIEFYKK